MIPNRISLYLDTVLGAALLLAGLLLTVADATGYAPDGTGSLGIAVLAGGHLLLIAAMLRSRGSREDEAFEHGKEYARVTQLH